MVFVDSNIFMYAAGEEHAHKIRSVRFLHRAAAGEIEACTSVEVLREILHRYRHIGRWDRGKTVYLLAKKIVPHILPLTSDILDDAYRLMEKYPSIYARDGVHAASCLAHGVQSIVSFDRDFDLIGQIRRIEP